MVQCAMTRYISTRGRAEPVLFDTALLSGMAPDGGLYVPEIWPALDRAFFADLQGRPYADIAARVIALFTGAVFSDAELDRLVAETYAPAMFDHPAIAPLTQLDADLWLMELFHGHTLSFKDYALQLVGRMFDLLLTRQNRRITIVGATSGDTGSAAIEACRGCANIDIVILHPHERTSPVQRRQMTTVDAPNVFNIALEGTFDDCQALVKALFADSDARAKFSLSAVNSINWARIMGQMVYYIAASLALGGPDRAVSFSVPTGNFGNIYAAHAVRRMGLPIGSLTVASNRNDILTRFFENGEMRVDTVTPSLSPSMDIQVSSNFERYLHDLLGRDGDAVSNLMESFRRDGSYRINAPLHRAACSDFAAYRCTDDDTAATMRACYAETSMVIDPHTAVGLFAAKKARAAGQKGPLVVLACAHPAKFPEAVRTATGIDPATPARLDAILKGTERFSVLANDYEHLKAYLSAHV